MRRILIFGFGGLLFLGLAAYAVCKLFPVQVGMALTERMVNARMEDTYWSDLPDGITVALCGTGSPIPDPTRAGPCTLVIAGSHMFIVDSGNGSTRNLLQMGVPVGGIDAVFLTHFHSDHIADLGELMLQRWIGAANDTPLTVYGPVGVDEVVAGFDAAYRLDDRYRTAHHGPTIAPPSGAGGVAATQPLGDAANAETIVFDQDGVRITMFRVNHEPVEPAVGYRFDYGGRSVVLSGDTAPTVSVTEHARNADLLIHEALQPHLVGVLTEAAEATGRANLAQITRDIIGYHTTPEDAAHIAAEADVRELVLNHIVPPLPSPVLYGAFLGNAQVLFHGPITVGEDGMIFTLPADEPGVIEDTKR